MPFGAGRGARPGEDGDARSWPRGRSDRGARSRRGGIRPLEPRAGDRAGRAARRSRALREVRGAAGTVRLAPRDAARGRHDAGLVPQGPGDAAQPGQPRTASCPTCTSAAGWSTSSTTAARSRTRIEFHDYLEWAAAEFADRVDYGTEVDGHRPRCLDGAAGCWTCARRGGPLRTRNVVLATGLVPQLPDGVRDRRPGVAQPRPAHPDRLGRATPRRVIVVGAGQSAAEVGRPPAPDVPAGRGLRGVRALRLQPRRRQRVRQPRVRPRGGRRLLPARRPRSRT